MTPHKANGKEYLLVSVPEGAKLLHIDTDFSDRPYLAYKFKDDLPPGSWQILCLASEATEQQAAMVVKKDDKLIWNDWGRHNCARDALFSLLTSLKLDPKTTLIIVKQ